MRFIIIDSLPYLYANGKAYAVRWDDRGFTVGAEVELTSAPSVTYSELSIKAKCPVLDSIGVTEQDNEPETDSEVEQEGKQVTEQDNETETEQIDFASMSLGDLKDYVANNNIDIKGARSKVAIIEAINAAE